MPKCKEGTDILCFYFLDILSSGPRHYIQVLYYVVPIWFENTGQGNNYCLEIEVAVVEALLAADLGVLYP